MVQILPTVLKKAFALTVFDVYRNAGDSTLDNICNCLNKLGELCSLAYMSKINSKFSIYVDLIDKTAKELIVALDSLDHTVVVDKHTIVVYSIQLDYRSLQISSICL
jgi:hypothetical protein